MKFVAAPEGWAKIMPDPTVATVWTEYDDDETPPEPNPTLDALIDAIADTARITLHTEDPGR